MEIENAHSNNGHGLCWKLIKKVSGCRSACQGKLEEDTKADSQKWYNHFKGLLGNPSSFNNETEDIDPVFTDLNIKQDHLHLRSITRQRSLKEKGKVVEKIK